MVHQRLGTGADHHLVRSGHDSPGQIGVPGDFLPQHRFSLAVSFGQKPGGMIGQYTGHAFLPLHEIEGFQIVTIQGVLRSAEDPVIFPLCGNAAPGRGRRTPGFQV